VVSSYKAFKSLETAQGMGCGPNWEGLRGSIPISGNFFFLPRPVVGHNVLAVLRKMCDCSPLSSQQTFHSEYQHLNTGGTCNSPSLVTCEGSKPFENMDLLIKDGLMFWTRSIASRVSCLPELCKSGGGGID
jgi:hypothetical protein